MPKKECSLDPRTELMVKLIFNDDMFKSQMASMNLGKIVNLLLKKHSLSIFHLSDVKKMPLGKLSKSQIAKGLEVILDIEKTVNKTSVRCKKQCF